MGYGAAIGLILAAAGTAVQMSSANTARKNMNKSVVNSLKQQERFQKQATPVYEGAEKAVEDPHARMSAAAAENLKRYERANSSTKSYSGLPVDKSRLNMELESARGAAAENQSIANVFHSSAQKIGEAGRRMGVINNQSQSAAQTAPVLAQLAGQRSADAAAMGSLLSSAGTLAGIYAGVNSGAGRTQMASASGHGGSTAPYNAGGTGGHSNSQIVKLQPA